MWSCSCVCVVVVLFIFLLKQLWAGFLLLATTRVQMMNTLNVIKFPYNFTEPQSPNVGIHFVQSQSTKSNKWMCFLLKGKYWETCSGILEISAEYISLKQSSPTFSIWGHTQKILEVCKAQWRKQRQLAQGLKHSRPLPTIPRAEGTNPQAPLPPRDQVGSFTRRK